MGNEIRGDFNAAQLAFQLKDLGFDAQVVPAKLNIGEALNSRSGKTQGANKPNVVSKENYTYKNMQGVLVKYDDGTAVFQAKDKLNGKDVVYQYKFNNENDLKNNRPSAEILNPGDAKKQLVTSFEYQRNGKLKSVEVRNAKNTVIKQEEYDKKGNIQNRKLYDKNGNLQSDIRFKWNEKEHTSVAEAYDKDNKLTQTAYNKYQDDNKTVISQEVHYPSGKIKSESKYDDNGKIKTSVGYYENGPVKSETEYWDNGVIKEQRQYDEAGKVTKKITAEIDGNFENSAQVSEGDCYLMATINSIRELDNGQQMLKDLVKIETNANGEKVYTVTFPGAQVAAEGLKTDDRVDPNKMHITGTYTFTESEMEEILKQAGQKYSLGDGDVILLEAAFEKYREEVAQTLDENPALKTEMGVAGTQTGGNRNNILAGGYSEDPTFILTGKQSAVYSIYKDNPPYGLSYEGLQQGNLAVVPTNQNGELTKAAVSEVDGEYTKDKEDLNNMLDSIMRDGEDGHIDNIAVASFKVVHADGKQGGHALTIKSVTADTVTLINPWNPDKEITMSREDFIKSVGHLTVADTTKPSVTNEDVHNEQQATQHVHQNQQSQQGNSEQNVHSVKRGDNLWKIAKKHLGEGATSTQIANYVNDIMKANPALKWNSAHTHVMIRQGDNIILP